MRWNLGLLFSCCVVVAVVGACHGDSEKTSGESNDAGADREADSALVDAGAAAKDGHALDAESEMPVADGAPSTADGNAEGQAPADAAPDAEADAELGIGPPAPGYLIVAPDERHVAFLSDPHPAPDDNEIITGTLGVGTVDVSGVLRVRRVASEVPFYGVAFTADSRMLVFRDQVTPWSGRGNLAIGIGNLEVSAADGTAIRTIATAVVGQQVVGETVFYEQELVSMVQGDGPSYPVWTPACFAVSAAGGTPLMLTNGWGSPNPIGTATVYRTVGGYSLSPDSLPIVELPGGAVHTLSDPTTEQVGIFVWSNHGGYLAFVHQPNSASVPGLALVASDGTMRTEISTDCACRNISFAPDDLRVAYDKSDGQGGMQVVVHSLLGGPDVTLSGLPSGNVFSFSQDGQYVVASGSALYLAASGQNGPFRLLTSGIGAYSLDPGDGFAATTETDGTAQVVSFTGNQPVVVPATQRAEYEPISLGSHLLLNPPLSDQGALLPPGVRLASDDGSSVNLLPPLVRFASTMWLGRIVLARIAVSSGISDFYAVSDDGAVVTPLAAAVDSYAWAPIAAPRALFYGRSTSADAGAAGLFVTSLP